jgi:hypothetical protein
MQQRNTDQGIIHVYLGLEPFHQGVRVAVAVADTQLQSLHQIRNGDNGKSTHAAFRIKDFCDILPADHVPSFTLHDDERDSG